MCKLVIQLSVRNISLDAVELTKRALEVRGGALDGTAEWLERLEVTGLLSHAGLEW